MKKENEVLKHYKKLLNEALNDLKTPGKRHKQIPNILTVLRLLAPAVILPLAITGNIPLTLITAGAFAFTDAVDGFIARHWNLQSELGKDLDAVTDKVFSTTLLAAASVSNPLLLLNIGLEGVIALINANKKLNGYETASTMTGKLKTGVDVTLEEIAIICTDGIGFDGAVVEVSDDRRFVVICNAND